MKNGLKLEVSEKTPEKELLKLIIKKLSKFISYDEIKEKRKKKDLDELMNKSEEENINNSEKEEKSVSNKIENLINKNNKETTNLKELSEKDYDLEEINSLQDLKRFVLKHQDIIVKSKDIV